MYDPICFLTKSITVIITCIKTMDLLW